MFLQDEIPMTAGHPVVQDGGVFRIEAGVDDRRVFTEDDDQKCLPSLGKRVTSVLDEVLGHSGFRLGFRFWRRFRFRFWRRNGLHGKYPVNKD